MGLRNLPAGQKELVKNGNATLTWGLEGNLCRQIGGDTIPAQYQIGGSHFILGPVASVGELVLSLAKW